jgi:hypothetical protein
MRIQETNEILKESRHARTAVAQQHEDTGMFTKAWRMVSSLPHKITGLFHK